MLFEKGFEKGFQNELKARKKRWETERKKRKDDRNCGYWCPMKREIGEEIRRNQNWEKWLENWRFENWREGM